MDALSFKLYGLGRGCLRSGPESNQGPEPVQVGPETRSQPRCTGRKIERESEENWGGSVEAVNRNGKLFVDLESLGAEEVNDEGFGLGIKREEKRFETF